MHDCGNKSTPAWVELALAWTERHLMEGGRRDTCVDGGTLAWTDGRLCVPTSNLRARGK
jgi:hypothetical protein